MSVDLATFNPRAILVCQLRQIGDVVLMTPLLELLAKRFPGARIDALTEKKCAPVLEGNPYLSRIWPVDKKALPTLFHEVAYYWKVARQGYDLVADLQQTPRCRWVVAFSRAPVRLTRTPPWYTRPLYTHWADPWGGYASARKASVLSPLGITWNGERPRIVLRDDEKAAAAAYLASLGLAPDHILVAVDATHRRATRLWPAAHYARLLEMAAAEHPALRFQLLYGPGEENEARRVLDACAAADRILPLGRLLDLREMAACITHARLLLGNCSAPRHIAVAVGTPTLTIQGATSTGWVFPAPEHGCVRLGLPCQPCNKNVCDIGIRCLTDLTPEMVLPEFSRRLQNPFH